MMVYTLALFCLFLLALVVAGANTRAKALGQAAQWRALYRAARWLARYNAARTALVTDLCAVRLDLSYGGVQRLLNDRLAKQPYYGTLGQLVPLDLAPEGLRVDVELYNRLQLSDTGDAARFPVRLDRLETSRMALLELAVDILTRTEPAGVLEDIAEATGIPLLHVRAVADALRSRAEYDLNRVLREPDLAVALDPEEVLPGRS